MATYTLDEIFTGVNRARREGEPARAGLARIRQRHP
jgi:hypothetical protein